MIKLLADECCDKELVSKLRLEGHDVWYVPEFRAGAGDDEILPLAVEEGRVLLTEDKDFGELVYRLKKPAIGVILLRFETEDRELKLRRLIELIDVRGEKIPGSFVVVDREKFRFRRLLI